MQSLNKAVVFCLCLGLSELVFAVCGRAFPQDQSNEQVNLQLEVLINKIPTGKIGSFILFNGKRLGATRNELVDVGLRVKAGRSPQDIVLLDDIAGVSYEYDARLQRVMISAPDAMRVGGAYDLRGSLSGTNRDIKSGYGAVVNYGLTGSAGSASGLRNFTYSGSSLTLDGRVFSPYGTFSQSALATTGANLSSQLRRLDTSFQYEDADRAISYRAGDLISNSLFWTRSVRLGGVQAFSNFQLRPDLITTALPSVRGTAAVPSTVDIYVNNIRTASQQVNPGPFTLTNLPVITNGGNAQVVLRDASGQETRMTVPFYTSPDLLAKGKTDWSFEAGLPRRSYGNSSDTYLLKPVGSASLRHGLTDGLTVQAHAEGGAGVVNGGLGIVANTFNVGVAEASASASKSSLGSGLKLTASYDTKLFGLNIGFGSQRAFAGYDDIAGATARYSQLGADYYSYTYGLFAYLSRAAEADNAAAIIESSARPVKASDRINVSTSLPFDSKTSLGASFINQEDFSGHKSRVAEISLSRSMPMNISLSGSIFRDFGTTKNTGIYVGMSMPLGQGMSSSASVSQSGGAPVFNMGVSKNQGTRVGDYGWQINDYEGSNRYSSGQLSYRARYASVDMQAGGNANSAAGTLSLRGSVATMGGEVAAGNWIDDSFAIVKTGAPNVEVLSENNSVGRTDGTGVLLLPSLRSYERNKISVDPRNLPVDADLAQTTQFVTPASRSGVFINFAGKGQSNAALVTIVRKDGEKILPGTPGKTEDGHDFVVGYDGLAYIKGLQADNQIRLEFENGSCTASFRFEPRPGTQVRIGPVTCS